MCWNVRAGRIGAGGDAIYKWYNRSMTYRGSVKDGVVVIEGSPPLKEGTIVRVEPVEIEEAFPLGSPERIMRTIQSGAHW